MQHRQANQALCSCTMALFKHLDFIKLSSTNLIYHLDFQFDFESANNFNVTSISGALYTAAFKGCNDNDICLEFMKLARVEVL